MSKRCTKCEIEKSFSDFYPDLRHNDGKQSQCRKCHNKSKLNWSKKNPDYMKKYNLKWRENNPEYMKNYQRQYQKERKANDINFKLANNLRNRLRKALLNQASSKNDTTEELLGISYSEFREYIEFLMCKEMNWLNIHLDHVRPLSSFDLKDIEQLREAAYYTNIQPLLAKDNLLKGDRYHEYDIWLQSENVYDYAYFSTIK